MKKSIVARIVSIIFMIILVGGVVCLLFLPQLFDHFKLDGTTDFYYRPLIYKFALYSCYLLCLAIIYKLGRLFNVIYVDTPFKKEVESSLKVSAIMFMLLFIIVIIKALFIPTLLSFAVALICFVASLSFYVLAEVIKSAILYKEEIDYTV